MEEDIRGHYFTYCQFCAHDGNCELRHHEFMGVPSQGRVDETSYPGHEDVRWHFSIFQGNAARGTCGGRIKPTGSIYVPLVCECGTVLSSLTLSALFGGGMCGKFEPNERGKERATLARQIAARKHIALRRVSPEDLPPLDPNYHAAMEH